MSALASTSEDSHGVCYFGSVPDPDIAAALQLLRHGPYAKADADWLRPDVDAQPTRCLSLRKFQAPFSIAFRAN